MHPLVHAWGRDRMSSEDGQKDCLMAYGLLACSLPEDFDEKPYQFRRILVTHLMANIQHSVMAKKEMVDKYFDDAHEKFGRMLSEQGYAGEAEKFQILVLDVRSRTPLGEKHQDTIRAMGNLSGTYWSLGKYADAEKLGIKVLDMGNRLLEEDHPDTTMGNLANTYGSLGKYADAETLQIKVLDMRVKLLEEHPDTINATENLAITFHYLQKYTDAARLEVQVVDVRKKIFGEEHPKTVKSVALLAKSQSQANTNISGTESKKKGEFYLLQSLVNSPVHYISSLSFKNCK